MVGHNGVTSRSNERHVMLTIAPAFPVRTGDSYGPHVSISTRGSLFLSLSGQPAVAILPLELDGLLQAVKIAIAVRDAE